MTNDAAIAVLKGLCAAADAEVDLIALFPPPEKNILISERRHNYAVRQYATRLRFAVRKAKALRMALKRFED